MVILRVMIILSLIGSSLFTQVTDYDIYVANRDTDSIKRFDGDDGTYLGDFIEPDAGGLSQPQEVVFHSDGYCYVTGFQNTAVKKYDGLTGEYLGEFTSGYTLLQPTKMTFRPDGYLYVSQWGGTEKVVRFLAENGEFVDEFTSTGVLNGCGQAWDSEGNMYVSSWGNTGFDGTVQVFDSGGTFIENFAESTEIDGPVYNWFTPGGDLMIQDWTRGTVERFNSAGEYVETHISGMVRTEGFLVAPNGDIYACDWQINRINRYDSTGTFIEIFASGNGLLVPNGLAFGPAEVVDNIAGESSHTPKGFALEQNFPNPFNPSTVISLHLAVGSNVDLVVYDSAGRLVDYLARNTHLSAGEHSFTWDGTDVTGQQVASGVYFYELAAEDFLQSKRMVLLR